ncbi:DinB family protein [Eudoraea chungangensis]|uniref:DinB family protein n=1 Tax=Eudoraea chungangensis TaxID=1481905 RepID=UPI0023ED15F5|nr:DinB family protein [Eudoraea chungangensis]
MSNRLNQLLKQYKDIQNAKLWMGENYERKIKKIEEDKMFIRPYPSLHSVAEIIAHLNAWRKDAILKITKGEGVLKEEMTENWPSMVSLKEKGWPELWREHLRGREEFIQSLQNKEDSFLEETYYDQDFKGRYPYSFLIEGTLAHEIYHLGQLGIVIKLIKESEP